MAVFDDALTLSRQCLGSGLSTTSSLNFYALLFSGYESGVLCVDKAVRTACGDKIADVIKTVNGGQCLVKARNALSSSGTLSKNVADLYSYFVAFIALKFLNSNYT